MSRLKAGDTGYGLKWYWTPWNETDEGALRPDSRFFPFYNFADSFKYGKNIDLLGKPVDYEADERTQNYGPPVMMLGTDNKIRPYNVSGYRGASFSGWPKEQGTNFVDLADEFAELWYRFGRDMASKDYVEPLDEQSGYFDKKQSAKQRVAMNAWNLMNGDERSDIDMLFEDRPTARIVGSIPPIRDKDWAANELFNQMSHMFHRMLTRKELGWRGEPTKRKHVSGVDIMPVLTRIEVPRKSIVRTSSGADGRAPDDQRDTLAEMTATKYTPKDVIPTSEMIQDRKPWDFDVEKIMKDLRPLVNEGYYAYDGLDEYDNVPEGWTAVTDWDDRLKKYVGKHEPEVREILTRIPAVFHSNFGGYVPRPGDTVEDLVRRLKMLGDSAEVINRPGDFINRAQHGKRFAYENLFKYFPEEDPKDLSDEHKKKLLKDMSDDEEWREQCSKFKRDFA